MSLMIGLKQIPCDIFLNKLWKFKRGLAPPYIDLSLIVFEMLFCLCLLVSSATQLFIWCVRISSVFLIDTPFISLAITTYEVDLFLISNKNSINHEEKTNKVNTRCSWRWTQEKETNNNKDRKRNLRDNSKGSKKLNDGRTTWRTPTPRPIKNSTLA